MKFNPEEISVENLLVTYPTFTIPAFQREYAWDKYFYNKFLEDIIKGIKIGEEGNLELTSYFIGTMVFSGSKDESEIEVVDGQQRLTVITILLSAICSKLEELKENDLSNLTFKYIKDVDKNNNIIKRLQSKTSYPYFDLYVQSKEKSDIPNTKTEEEENIKNTYDYFKKYLEEKNLTSKHKNFEDKKYLEMLLKIRNQILSSKLISIVTGNKEHAFMIFEILNSKGKRLAGIDLIKNVIFEKVGKDTGKIGLAENLWEQIKSNLRKRGHNIGIDTFYRHYWISKYKKVTSNRLYDSFKTNKKLKNSSDCIDFLKELEKESNQYIKIISPIDDDYDRRQEYKWLVESLRIINDTLIFVQSRILLLALFDIKEKEKISTPSFKKSIDFLKHFVFVYTGVMGNNPNIYESRFSKLSVELRKSNNKDETNRILNELLYASFKDKKTKYNEFEEKFIELNFSKEKNKSNTLTKFVINEICKHMEDRDIALEFSSMEHMINENENNLNTLNIGNLICLEEPLNNEAGNLSYEEKIEIYKKSKYNCVKKLIKDYGNFSENDIEKRAKKLA